MCADLLDDELQLILSRVPLTNGSPKQLLALSAVRGLYLYKKNPVDP